jgi:hypothetical protein
MKIIKENLKEFSPLFMRFIVRDYRYSLETKTEKRASLKDSVFYGIRSPLIDKLGISLLGPLRRCIYHETN